MALVSIYVSWCYVCGHENRQEGVSVACKGPANCTLRKGHKGDCVFETKVVGDGLCYKSGPCGAKYLLRWPA